MKKFWIITALSFLSLAIPFAMFQQKASAAACHAFDFPPAYVEDCSNRDHWLPYCGPGNIYKSFDRCTNESFYKKSEMNTQAFFNAKWIWQFGHDGDYGIPDITSAEGANANDMSGFVNILRNALNSPEADI